jgi:2-polyprenyl-6-methoxyphenol hydroxylase-like FAD-dependent oxidoreductase
MQNRNVLISGASIAGPALAYWLRRHGFSPTVVERAPAPRAGGQAIDVRGAALEVLDRMGLLAEVRAAGTAMRGMSYVDGDGRELARLTDLTLTGGLVDGPDVELMRDDLVELLYRATREETEYLFDDSIAALRDESDGVYVDFESGVSRRFDLVIGADGLHSRVRALAFGPESEYLHHLGTYLSVFSAPNLLDLDHWQLFHLAEGRMVATYSARHNAESRIMFGFQSEQLGVDHRDVEAQRMLLADTFAGVGWRTQEFLAAMWRSRDFYLDSMSQVRMRRWSAGRVALVGDAGYGPSPLSGQGTSLALVGAYVLAGEVARSGGDHARGFEGYQRILAEYVRLNQELALAPARRKSTRFANWRAIQLLRLLNVLPGRRRVIELAMRPLRRAADGIVLPDYAALVGQPG